MSSDAQQDALQKKPIGSNAIRLFAERNRALGLLLFVFVAWTVLVAFNPTDTATLENVPDDFVIDLNAATEAELNLLPGVGIKLAQEILRYRDEHGVFQSVDDLTNIKGIKGGRVASLRRHLTVIPNRSSETETSSQDSTDQRKP